MPTRKRVLFMIGSLGGGGAERQTLHYLRHLDRENFEPLLYLTSAEGELLNDIPKDVPVISFWQRHMRPRLNFPGRIHRQQVRDLAKVLEDNRIDALCAATFYSTMIAAQAVSRRPTGWFAVEMADPRLDFNTQTTRFRWIKQRKLKAAYRSADVCVAVSDGVRDGLREMYQVPERTIATLPNFIDLEETDLKAAAAGPTWRGDGIFHIVCAGRLHVQKGHRYLIEAIDDLVQRRGRTNLRLHLLGQGPLDGLLRSMVQQRGLQDFVAFEGFVANPQAWMAVGQLFCLPSLFEGLPLALLEAMACRVPVLATDCPSGPAEVLDGGRFGHLVAPRDSTALADKIEEAIDDHASWNLLTEAARQRVEQDYSIRSGISKLHQILDKVISRES